MCTLCYLSRSLTLIALIVIRSMFIRSLIFLLLVSCGQYEKNNFLPEPIRLEGVRILESQIGIKDVEHIDSMLIISTLQEPLFRVFSKNGNYLGGFGRIGNGPDEFPIPMSHFFADVFRTNLGIDFLIHNMVTNTMKVVNLSESLTSGDASIRREYGLPRELSSAMGPFIQQVNDSLLIGMYEDRISRRIDEKRGYFYYYADEGRFETISLTNLEIDRKDYHASININSRLAHISPNRLMVVMAYLYVPRIDILAVETKTIKTLINDDIPSVTSFSLDDFNSQSLIEYYDAVYATDERIYVSYIGQIPSDDREMLIRVMDWSGSVLAQYVIAKEYNIIRFVVDETNSTIYGYSNGLDAIFEFKFGQK